MNAFYDIERIICHRTREDGEIEYFVKWKGYSSNENTWEPKENFASMEMIDVYYRTLAEKTENSEKMTPAAKEDGPLTGINVLEGDELNNLQPHKILNIFHLNNDKKKLIVYMQFTNRNLPQFVPADWVNKNYPHMVIKFYESRIYWRETRTGKLTKRKQSIATIVVD